MSNKPIVIRLKRSYLAAFNTVLGFAFLISRLSLLPLEDTDSGIHILFALMLIWGVAYLVSGLLLFMRTRIGLYFAALVYLISLAVIFLPKFYALLSSSQLTEDQQYWLRFEWGDIVTLILFGFLLYWVYRLFKTESEQLPAS